MKKIFASLIALTVLLALGGCQKKWTSCIDLGVFGKRINIENQLEEDFTITVFSNTDWNAEVTLGEDWLTLVDHSGNSLGFIHAHHADYFGNNARKGKIRISAGDKEIIINVVQAGNLEKASDVPDELL